MDRIQYYIDRITEAQLWPLVISAPALAVIAFLLVPAPRRLGASLVIMAIWLTVGQLPELGAMHDLAKATEIGAFALVFVTAWAHPGPKRRLAGWTLVHVVMAVAAFIYIVTVRDFSLAMVIRMQWLMLVLAALQVAKTITDEEALNRIMRSLAIGLAIAVFVPLSALFVQRSGAFIRGLGRFAPYGANPNQIGILFTMTAATSVWLAMTTRSHMWKPILFVICAIAVGLGLLTASRSTIVTMAIVLAPLVMSAARRPGLVLVGGAVLLLGVMFVMGRAEERNLSRLTTLETERFHLIGEYVEVISHRPLFGLLTSRGESFMADDDIGSISHNAYIDLLRFGGVTYAIPLFAVIAYSSLCAWRIWRRRLELFAVPITATMIAAFMGAIYLHGFVNGAIYYPTYTWAFLHILLASLFMTWWRDIQRGEAIFTPDEETWGLEDLYVQYGDYGEPVEAASIAR